MDRKNKKYSDFKKICGIVSVPAERMAGLISSGGRTAGLQLETHDRTTGKRFRISIESHRKATDEYLMAVYEIKTDGNAVMFRNWITLKRPRNKSRVSGVSAILGLVMLVAAATSAGAAFYYVVMGNVAQADPFVEVVKFKVTSLSDSNDLLADIGILTNRPDSVSIRGDVEERLLTDTDGLPGPDTDISEHRRGTLLNLTGMLELVDGMSGRELVTIEVRAGGSDISVMYQARIARE